MRIFLVAVVLGIAAAAPSRTQTDPLNVVVILADDLGYGDPTTSAIAPSAHRTSALARTRPAGGRFNWAPGRLLILGRHDSASDQRGRYP